MYIQFAFQQMLSLLGKILSTYCRKDAIEVSGFSLFSMVDYDSFPVVFLMCNLYLTVFFLNTVLGKR